MKNNIGIGILLGIVIFLFIFLALGNIGSAYNGQYKNNADNGSYVMISDNGDGTFAVVFVKCSEFMSGSMMTYPVQLDRVEIEEDILKDTSFSSELEIKLQKDSIVIPEGKALGNEEFEGTYKKVRNISEADPENFKEV